MSNENRHYNWVSVVLKVLAWLIIIGGFFAGFYLGKVEVSYLSSPYGDYSSYEKFSTEMAALYWAAFFVGGMIIRGLAEVIQLLEDVRSIALSNVHEPKQE